MSLDRLDNERLFQNHSRETLSTWCKSLKFFSYMRARQGHSCEGDSFSAHFKYTDIDDLKEKLSLLGISLKPLEEGCIPFDPFGFIPLEYLDKIRYTIPKHDDLEQPQDTEVLGNKAYIWVQQDRFEISISGTNNVKQYEVSDNDFEVCLKLEKEFEQLGWQKIVDEEIKTHPHCISKEKYPELYD